MIRLGLVWTTVLLLATATGCRMCADTHDYCGPIEAAGACGGECGMCAPRSGSILSGFVQTVPVEAEHAEVFHGAGVSLGAEDSYVIDEPIQQGPMLTRQPVWEEGVVDSKLISVEDRAVSEIEPEIESAVVQSTDPTSDGWTATRPARNRGSR